MSAIFFKFNIHVHVMCIHVFVFRLTYKSVHCMIHVISEFLPDHFVIKFARLFSLQTAFSARPFEPKLIECVLEKLITNTRKWNILYG